MRLQKHLKNAYLNKISQKNIAPLEEIVPRKHVLE
jgi:hypothetical protein